MYINGEYTFQFIGTLQSKYTISVTSVSVDNNVLKVEPSVMVDAAGSQTYKEVREITIAGNTYDLVAVSINGMTITEEQLNNVLETDSLTITAYGDVKVQLQYTVRLSNGEGA